MATKNISRYYCDSCRKQLPHSSFQTEIELKLTHNTEQEQGTFRASLCDICLDELVATFSRFNDNKKELEER